MTAEFASQITNRTHRYKDKGRTAIELRSGKPYRSTTVFRREGDSDGVWREEVDKLK